MLNGSSKDWNYLVTAFAKWVDGEPLSQTDVERLLHHFETNDLRMAGMSPEETAALKARFKAVMVKRFVGASQ